MANAWPKPKPVVPVAIAILQDKFPGVAISDEIPDPRPARFIKVTSANGAYDNPAFTEPRVLVECWASDSATAEDMALDGMRAFKNSIAKTFAGANLKGADLQGPTDYNDPAIQDRRRCQFHGTLIVSTK